MLSVKKTISSTIGFPRIGPCREMKKGLEDFWANKTSVDDLLTISRSVEELAWSTQAEAGVDLVALDGTLYDHVLDAIFCLGLLPDRFNDFNGVDRYFAAARGAQSAPALDMSKFMDTNYHYLCPELSNETFPTGCNWSTYTERTTRAQNIIGRAKAVPMVIGPLTLVSLAKGDFNRSEMINRLVPCYIELLVQLQQLQVPEVQVHEPILATDGASKLQSDAEYVYTKFADVNVPIHLVVSYDDVSEEVYKWLIQLPVHAIGLDFCGVPGAAHGCHTAQLIAKYGFPKTKRLGAGIIDGRSVWADDGTASGLLKSLRTALGNDQVIAVQSSTSLQHVPYDASIERNLPVQVSRRLAFAVQKLHEMVSVAANSRDVNALGIDLQNYTGAPVQDQGLLGGLSDDMFHRSEPYTIRRGKQPSYKPFPTTTIGSFPQTPAIRRARLQYKKGIISEAEYSEKMAVEIGYAVGVQSALGLDVLVHGEAERSDMVECFGTKLDGFVFTEAGWVQSYGSRYVRPPIIAGDISRPRAMTVHEYLIAQGVTSERPVKGMLTGPVTILNWSFPRKDVSRSVQAFQIALALRNEVSDLEKAGCRILQVDEPALREGLPLKMCRWEAYLDWATAAFRLATTVAAPSTQIVTHLCYSEFEDILPAIDALDADVLTIENSRSDNAMVKVLADFGYSRDLGPGVYDVHSPVVPTVDSLVEKIRSFLATGILGGDATRIHINPDCGLKTRRWEEVIPALRNMVEAVRRVRLEMGAGDSPAPVL